jgi:hypothetical protein
MALGIDTLITNKSVFNPDQNLLYAGQGIWNLTKSSLSYKDVNIQIDTAYITSEDDVMRPDLIAFAKYGDQGKVGSLMKFNSISNPFAMGVGQYLYLPTSTTFEAAFSAKSNVEKGGNTNTSPSAAFRKEQEQKIVKPSEGRRKFVESKIKKQPNQILPPNVMQEGERATVRKNGIIVFGPDAGGGGFNGANNNQQ